MGVKEGEEDAFGKTNSDKKQKKAKKEKGDDEKVTASVDGGIEEGMDNSEKVLAEVVEADEENALGKIKSDKKKKRKTKLEKDPAGESDVAVSVDADIGEDMDNLGKALSMVEEGEE